MAAWIVGPLLLMAAAYFPTRFYCGHRSRDLDRRYAVLEQLPEMNRQLERADSIAKNLGALPPGDADATAVLGTAISQAAVAHGLTIHALTLDKEAPLAKGGVLPATAAVRADGTLSAIVSTLDDLQRPERLFRIESVNLKVMASGPDLVYSGDIVLRGHVVSW